MHTETLKVEEIGKKSNHVEQSQRHPRTKNPNEDRQGNEPENAGRRRKVAEGPLGVVRVRNFFLRRRHRGARLGQIIMIGGISHDRHTQY
jgi:hypothetical protein